MELARMGTKMIPFHKQETNWTCGAAAMRMILEACSITKTEKQVVKLVETNKVRGTYAKSFPKAAEKFKLNYSVYRNATIDDMRSMMHKGYHILTGYYVPREKVDHYAVIKHIDEDIIYILDPYYGPTHKYKISHFKRIWKLDPKYDNEKAWFIAVKK
jgi:ABC-type bacteriocin/lantibiotic exporter with double-glycine peptidase domain